MSAHSLQNSLIVYNGYPLSVVVALFIHLALLSGILYLQSSTEDNTLELIQPTIIKSLFIEENPQVVNARNIERQRLERLEQQRQAREEEARRQQQQEEQQRLERERAEQERQQALQREREQQQQLERERAEQARLEQERAAEAERERLQREQERELERQRQLAEQDRQRQEAAEAAAAEAARTEFELVQSATGLIQTAVTQQWSRPPSARNGMRAVLRIAMLPTGDVTDVSIVESSNDPAFDRSAENAVYRAAPFRELESLPIHIFNANFRSLTLIFQPEDLLN